MPVVLARAAPAQAAHPEHPAALRRALRRLVELHPAELPVARRVERRPAELLRAEHPEERRVELPAGRVRPKF